MRHQRERVVVGALCGGGEPAAPRVSTRLGAALLAFLVMTQAVMASPVSPAEAPATLATPDDFEATLFGAEPLRLLGNVHYLLRDFAKAIHYHQVHICIWQCFRNLMPKRLKNRNV